MKKIYAFIIIVIVPFVVGCNNTGVVGDNNTGELTNFVVNYGTVEPQDISNKQIAILESGNYNHMQVLSLKRTGVKIVGYVSLGEVGTSRWYFPLLKDRGFLGKNENWNSYYINLRDSVSRNILLNEVIPNIIDKGFDGLFLDTIDDVAPYTERADLQPYMADLIVKIRQKYPNIYIMQNAGLFLLDKTHNDINGVLVEDVASYYNFSDKKYGLSSEDDYIDKINTIIEYRKKYNLPFYIVDYANTMILYKKITQRLDTLNIPYYINDINLQ